MALPGLAAQALLLTALISNQQLIVGQRDSVNTTYKLQVIGTSDNNARRGILMRYGQAGDAGPASGLKRTGATQVEMSVLMTVMILVNSCSKAQTRVVAIDLLRLLIARQMLTLITTLSLDGWCSTQQLLELASLVNCG